MNIFEDIKMILIFQLVYQLQNAHTSFEDSGTDADESQELNESKSNAEIQSSEEQKHSHNHHHVYRAGYRHKKKSHSHDHDHDHDHTHLRTTSNEYNDDCECACNKCDQPSECCKFSCTTCPSNAFQQATRGQPNVLFIPYPYPMMLPSPDVRPTPNHEEMMRARDNSPEPTATSTTTTTTTTTPAPTTTSTTTKTTTTTEDPTDVINSESNNKMLEAVLKSVMNDYSNIIAKTPDELPNGHSKYMLTSLRRTKPTWMPKFGIVPITDNIAEKLLTKISKNVVPLRSQQKKVSMYDKSYLRSLNKKY